MAEPQEVLADIADVGAVVAVPAPAGVLPISPDTGVVAELAALPLRQVAIHCVARGR